MSAWHLPHRPSSGRPRFPWRPRANFRWKMSSRSPWVECAGMPSGTGAHPPRCPLKRVLCARTGQPAPCCICCCIARRVLSGVKPKLVWCWTREGWSLGTLTTIANLAFATTDAKARCTAQPATEEIARAWSRNHLVSFRRPSPRELLLHSTCLHGGVEWRHDERVAYSGGTCGDGTNRPPEYSNAECLSGQCVYDCFLCTNCNFGNCKCK